MLSLAWDFEQCIMLYAVDKEGLDRRQCGLFASEQTLSTEYFGCLVEALSLRDSRDVLFAGVVISIEDQCGEGQVEQQVEEGLHLIQDYRSSYLEVDWCQKLISMLIRAKILLPLLRLSKKFQPSIAACFGTRKWNKKEFLKKLEKEIIDSQSQIIIDDPHNEAYFKNKGWNIQYKPHNTLFSFHKTTATRQAKVLVHVKDDPPNTQEHLQQAEPPQQQHNQRINYSQVGIYIRRKGEEKWLTAEMAVMQGSVELMGVYFSFGEPDCNWENGMYPGPQLKSLPQEVLGVIQLILEETGVSAQVLMNMVILASNKVDELDLQWLKDLRDIWS